MKTVVIIENQGTHVIEDEHRLTIRQAMKEIGLDWRQYAVVKTAEAKTRTTYTVTPVSCPAPEKQVEEEHRQGPSPGADEAVITAVDEVTTSTALSPLPKTRHKTVAVHRKEFEEALKVAIDIIPRKNHLPILSCVKLAGNGEALFITATDLEMAWTRKLVSRGDALSLCVSAALLYKEVKALPREITEVALRVEDNQVSVNARCFIKLSDPAEYPEIEPVNPAAEIPLPDLAHKVKRVFPAVSTDETRYMLCCVYFDFPSGMMVATDGYRLHTETIEACDLPPIALPRNAASLLVKHPGSGAIRMSDTRVSFDLAGGELAVRPMMVTYPDWKGILGGFNADAQIEFSAEAFLKVLEGVIPVTDTSRSVVLSANGDLTIEAFGELGAYSWHIPCYVTGTPPVLTFNLTFLSDAIRAYAGDGLVSLQCRKEYGPILVNDHAVVMPVRR